MSGFKKRYLLSGLVATAVVATLVYDIKKTSHEAEQKVQVTSIEKETPILELDLNNPQDVKKIYDEDEADKYVPSKYMQELYDLEGEALKERLREYEREDERLRKEELEALKKAQK